MSDVLDFDGCGDGDRDLQANARWTGAFYSSGSTSAGAFGYGTEILQGGNAARAFDPLAWPLIGWHMNTRINTNPTTGHEVTFRENSLVCCTLKFPSSGAILIYNAPGTLVGTVPAGTWPFQAWAYIEVSVKVHNSAGSVEIFLFGNTGTPDISVTGIDTLPVSGTGVCNNIRWYGVSGNSHWVDDWYLKDGSVSDPLGGAIIDAQAANGDSLAEWTRSTGSTNFGTIDERPFSATDYVSTGVDGKKDRYTLASSSNTDAVQAVRVIGQMKKADNVSAAKARLLIHDDGAQGSGTTRTLSTTAADYADVFNVKPSDSSDWDAASVNALLIGVERIAA